MDINGDIDPFGSDSDLLSGAAPTEIDHTSPMTKTEFAPWHKPRKQWIRDNQWGRGVSALINSLGLSSESRPLNYLSLPGVDLLDVRALEDVCAPVGVKLNFLGMNHIDNAEHELQAEQALSLNEVRSLDYIHQESTVITERFEDLCDPQSLVSQRVLRAHTSYDVINIDLCASFAKHKPGTWDSLYTAIYKLMSHQAHYRTEPWIFFITTRIDKKKVDSDAFIALMNAVQESVNPDVVMEYIGRRMGVDHSLISGRRLTQENLSIRQHADCFVSAFGIWKIRLLLSGDSRTKSSMKVPFAYHVDSTDAVPDMSSMSFWCERLPPKGVDPSGLTSLVINPGRPDVDEVYQSCSCRAFRAALDSRDLDVYLLDNPGDFKGAMDKSKSLLKRARYSLEAYDEWVEQQQDKIRKMVGRDHVERA